MDYLDYKSSGAEEDEVSLPQAILEKAVNLIDVARGFQQFISF